MAVTDRRKAYRLNIRMKLLIEGVDHMGQAFAEETESLNVSLDGVGFYSGLVLSSGQHLVVSVPGKCRINGRIVWIGEENSEKLREVGVQLLPPLTDWVIR